MKAETIAKYFLNKDIDGVLFNDNLIDKNGHKSYEGNLRLNKYLHIAQNLFITKNNKLLFEDSLYAFENGGVVENIRKQYSRIKNNKSEYDEQITIEMQTFLDKVYKMLKNATIDELIQISHEDVEWIRKNKNYSKAEQKMDSLANIEQYKEQYADSIYVMENLC